MPDENEIISNIAQPDADQGTGDLDPLEAKYRDQMRQIVTQKIELPISALNAMLDPKGGQIDLSPEFQRRSIWDNDRRSRLIESIIMNIPVPPVFLGETEYGQYVVLDGRQRLTAIHEFLRNNFRLTKLKVWQELNGKSYNDLVDSGLEKFFVRRFVSAIVVLRESSSQVKYDVFDRLNTGGVEALPMEIRNAVFPGKFNLALHSLSTLPNFLQLWEIPAAGPERNENVIFNRMYDLEMVLRFFAVPEYAGGMRFKDYLGDYLAQRNAHYAADANLATQDRAKFERSCLNTWTIFRGDAFRRALPDGNRARYKSAPLADAVMYAVSDIPPERLVPVVAARVKAAFDAFCVTNLDFVAATTAGTNGVGAIQKRLALARAAIQGALG